MRRTFGFRFQLLIVVALLWALPLLAQQEVPQVPPVIRFADMTLHLTQQAQRDIQADVDALYRSPKYFYMKLERVDMYLPLIEPILAEHGVPDDIKYLVIQESALISDAVSSSNAVGFWQFKEASATEVGMRVDRQVDERMNIVASTAGAAKYLLRSNSTFNNWLYSVQSYQMGLGGATRSLNNRYYGANEMRIDGDTYWYVKKFLSHLIAFRDAVGKQPRNLMLYQHKNCANKTLEDIALELNAEPELLTEYNKWLKTSRVPDDREYVVIVPVHIDEAPNLLAENETTAKDQINKKSRSLEDKLFGEKQKEPDVPNAVRDRLAITKVNGIQAAVARAGDNARGLAKAGDISVSDFLKYNDMKPGDALKPGQVYYFRKKKKKATVYRHVLAEGESLWDVSQKYGVRMDKLLQKNRMKEHDAVKPGQVIWLRYIRPADQPVAYEAVPKQKAEARPKAEVQQPAEQTPAPVEKPANQQFGAEDKGKKPARQIVQEKQAPAQPQVQVKDNGAVAAHDQPIVASARPVAYEQPKMEDKVVVAVDTPITKPTPVKAPQQTKKAAVDTLNDEMHIFPGANADQRNIFPENNQKSAEPAMQVIERNPEKPDSFAVHGPVKFIGEEDPLLEQQPIRTAPAQTQSLPPTQEQAVTLQPAPQPKAAAPDTVHQVKTGETLYSISKKYGLSVQELRERNGMGPNAVLSVGQVLQLKEAKKAPAAVAQPAAPLQAQQEAAVAGNTTLEDNRYVYHTVGEGETMYRVARKYNVTIKDIMEWNKKEDFNIRPGEVLVVGRK